MPVKEGQLRFRSRAGYLVLVTLDPDSHYTLFDTSDKKTYRISQHTLKQLVNDGLLVVRQRITRK
jgi:hypothetical protein